MMLDELRACERLAEERRVAMLSLMAEVDAAKDVGFRAGAEWMRELAAKAVESTEEYSFSVAVKMAPSDHLACAVSRVRSLPVSPPADTK